MPLFLLANWRWLLPSAAAAVLGIWLGITKMELSSLRADVEKQKAEAAQLLAEKTAEVAAKERAAAELNSQLESQRHDADVQTAAADAKLRDALRVRQQSLGRACRTSPLPASSSSSGAQDSASGGPDRLADSLDDLTAKTVEATNQLAAYARECHSFVQSLGH